MLRRGFEASPGHSCLQASLSPKALNRREGKNTLALTHKYIPLQPPKLEATWQENVLLKAAEREREAGEPCTKVSPCGCSHLLGVSRGFGAP